MQRGAVSLCHTRLLLFFGGGTGQDFGSKSVKSGGGCSETGKRRKSEGNESNDSVEGEGGEGPKPATSQGDLEGAITRVHAWTGVCLLCLGVTVTRSTSTCHKQNTA